MCPHEEKKKKEEEEEVGEERSFRERSRQDRVLYRISPRIASKDRCKPVAVGSLLSRVRREAERSSQHRHTRCAQLISARISDLSLLPGGWRCVRV